MPVLPQNAHQESLYLHLHIKISMHVNRRYVCGKPAFIHTYEGYEESFGLLLLFGLLFIYIWLYKIVIWFINRFIPIITF